MVTTIANIFRIPITSMEFLAGRPRLNSYGLLP